MFGFGIVWGVMAEMGKVEFPEDGTLRAIDFGAIILNLFAVFIIGNKMYARQMYEEGQLELATPSGAAYDPTTTLIDPDNPFASSTQR